MHENYYRISDWIKTIDSGIDKYLVQTRSQTKSSGMKVPEVHGASKGLIPHMKPECQKSVAIPTTCPTPPTCHLRPTHQSQTKDHLQMLCHPYPNPRIGKGRAGIRRKPRITLPIPRPIQTPTPPTPTPAPRLMQPLPEPVTKSQESTLSWHHVPAVLQPLVQPTPASITQPIEPKVDHRPIPPYHEPFVRLQPRLPDATAVKDNRKDLSDLDTDRKINLRKIQHIRRV